jgi:hypothetical protein
MKMPEPLVRPRSEYSELLALHLDRIGTAQNYFLLDKRSYMSSSVIHGPLLGDLLAKKLPDYAAWEGYEGWTAGLVRTVIERVAQATDEETEELLEAATRDARFKMERTKLEAEKVERDLRNMARERLLPDEKTLEKIARYEAHLSRGLYKALHELEALQTRRTGGVAPLARLDVDGVAGG